MRGLSVKDATSVALVWDLDWLTKHAQCASTTAYIGTNHIRHTNVLAATDVAGRNGFVDLAPESIDTLQPGKTAMMAEGARPMVPNIGAGAYSVLRCLERGAAPRSSMSCSEAVSRRCGRGRLTE